MLGRPRESARLGGGRGSRRCAGTASTTRVLVANWVEALLAIGEWDEADRRQRRRAPRRSPPTTRTWLLILRADRRDRPRRFRRRARASRSRARHAARRTAALGDLRRLRRRARPVGAPLDGRRRGRPRRPGAGAPATRRPDPRPALRQGTARAGGAGGARPRPPRRRRRPRPLDRARTLLDVARRAAAEARRSRPNAAGWLALAEAEYERARGVARPDAVVGGRGRRGSGSNARRSPPTAAGARPRRSSPPARPRAEASVPLREAHAVAARIGAQPLLRELELLAERARLDLTPPDAEPPRQSRRSRSSSG